MKKKVFFLDIDGTLIPTKIGTRTQAPSAFDAAAIQKAQALGHKVIFCTGRSYAIIPPPVKNAIHADGAVAGGGADVRLGDKRLYSRSLTDEQIRLILSLAHSRGARCYLEGESYNFGLYSRREDDARELGAPENFPFGEADAGVSKGTLFDDLSNPVYDPLRADFDLFAHPDYFDICLKGETKARGMALIMEALGMDRSQAVAIGDSDNDLEGILYAGCGVAMGNACDSLKKAADMITLPLNESGAGHAILKLIEEEA